MGSKVMVVEDSASMRQLLEFTLTDAGYEVYTAPNGKDALGMLDREVDIVITDLNMPVMNGMSLIRNIRDRKDLKFLPVLVLTTESKNEIKEEGRQAGASGWIVKPFTPLQLITAVKKLVD